MVTDRKPSEYRKIKVNRTGMINSYVNLYVKQYGKQTIINRRWIKYKKTGMCLRATVRYDTFGSDAAV